MPGTFGKRQLATFALIAVVGLAIVGWVAARQIKSPAQIAADTAPPVPAPITVPAVRKTLATEVIVRGTVRYGAPQAVVLGTSRVKQGSDIVTRPPRRNTRLGEGDVAMAVDGRPVFVFRGAIPMHRDLMPGDHGADVLQLERALSHLGFNPGRVDGRYDAATQAAVSSFYLHKGYDPFGATDTQLEALRTAQSAASQARDAYLQALNTVQASHPMDVAQARSDAAAAQDALDSAVLGVTSAQQKLATARGAARTAASNEAIAVAGNRRDQAAADADVAAKQAALDAAQDDERVARAKYDELPPDAPQSDREEAAAAVRQSSEKVASAQADLAASIAADDAVRAGASPAVQKAHEDTAQARRDVREALAELARARQAVRTARAQARQAALKARLLSADGPTLSAMRANAAAEAARTQAEVARLSHESGIQVPADEVLFFPTLPLRVDTVKAKRGATVSGPVMDVTNSRLAIDSSLSVSDDKLVRPGDPVTIEDQDLGITLHGHVSRVANTPGTNRVDPSRFYLEVIPNGGSVQLVGASVKLTIAVKSTKGAVLAVPVSALSIGGDGNSRVQVRRGGRTRIVTVVPGLAAKGLVEVRPVGRGRLEPGDLVVVGSRGGGGGVVGGGDLGGPGA